MSEVIGTASKTPPGGSGPTVPDADAGRHDDGVVDAEFEEAADHKRSA